MVLGGRAKIMTFSLAAILMTSGQKCEACPSKSKRRGLHLGTYLRKNQAENNSISIHPRRQAIQCSWHFAFRKLRIKCFAIKNYKRWYDITSGTGAC